MYLTLWCIEYVQRHTNIREYVTVQTVHDDFRVYSLGQGVSGF